MRVSYPAPAGGGRAELELTGKRHQLNKLSLQLNKFAIEDENQLQSDVD